MITNCCFPNSICNLDFWIPTSILSITRMVHLMFGTFLFYSRFLIITFYVLWDSLDGDDAIDIMVKEAISFGDLYNSGESPSVPVISLGTDKSNDINDAANDHNFYAWYFGY